MTRRKVFCIGWHKTGTSSLGLALIELDYTVVGCRLDLEGCMRSGNYEDALKIAERFDAVQDVPWALLYKELDQAFPGSKFIFTDREDEAWLRSAIGHFGDTYHSMHEWIYGAGSCVGNEDVYLARYRQHRLDVKQYFSARPNDILSMNLGRSEGWDELCRFLGCEIPKKLWPHANKGKHSFNRLDHTIDRLRTLTPMSLRRFVFGIKLRIRSAIGLPDPRNKFNNFKENRFARGRKP